MKTLLGLNQNSRLLSSERTKFEGVRIKSIMFNKLKMLPSDSK